MLHTKWWRVKPLSTSCHFAAKPPVPGELVACTKGRTKKLIRKGGTRRVAQNGMKCTFLLFGHMYTHPKEGPLTTMHATFDIYPPYFQ